MKKIVLFWILLITLGVKAFADEKVTFTTSAPDAVVVGVQCHGPPEPIRTQSRYPGDREVWHTRRHGCNRPGAGH